MKKKDERFEADVLLRKWGQVRLSLFPSLFPSPIFSERYGRIHSMFTFSPTINIGYGKKTDKPKEVLEPQPATPVQTGTAPIHFDMSDPAFFLMLMALVLLSGAVLVYAARH